MIKTPLKKFLIALTLFTTFCLFSCNSYRKKTFLDFEYGMSYNEYITHASNLERSGIIRNLQGRTFDYNIVLPNEKYVFFKVSVNVFSNARLSTIYAYLQYHLNDHEKRQLFNTLASKHGKPTTDFYKDKENGIWYAVWDQGNSEVRLVLADNDPTIGSGSMIFSAEGSLYDNIKAKDKKENGIIDVENKY